MKLLSLFSAIVITMSFANSAHALSTDALNQCSGGGLLLTAAQKVLDHGERTLSKTDLNTLKDKMSASFDALGAQASDCGDFQVRVANMLGNIDKSLTEIEQKVQGSLKAL